MIWFNPPWNDEVSTNVAKKFLAMRYRHFPKGSALGKHFNRSTVKVSYSSMPNMARIISGHNKKMTGSSTSMEPRAATVGRNPARWRGSARPPTLSTRWRPPVPPSSTSDSPQTPSRRGSLDTKPPSPTASMPTRRPSQATSGR